MLSAIKSSMTLINIHDLIRGQTSTHMWNNVTLLYVISFTIVEQLGVAASENLWSLFQLWTDMIMHVHEFRFV